MLISICLIFIIKIDFGFYLRGTVKGGLDYSMGVRAYLACSWPFDPQYPWKFSLYTTTRFLHFNASLDGQRGSPWHFLGETPNRETRRKN